MNYNKLIVFCSIGFILFACSPEKEEVKTETNTSFQQVYEMSEMALLMEKMYDELEQKRKLIIDEKSIGEYPLEFNKIHTAEMTSSFERTEEYNRLANLYLQNLKLLYESSETDPNRKEMYNNVVKSCLTCHRSDAGCIGPVDRIGKLLINGE